jgi:hypothetical protein
MRNLTAFFPSFRVFGVANMKINSKIQSFLFEPKEIPPSPDGKSEKPLDLSATIERAMAISRVLPADHASMVTLSKAMDEAINAELTGDKIGLTIYMGKLNHLSAAIETSGVDVSVPADHSETLPAGKPPVGKVTWLDRDRITHCSICGEGSYYFDSEGNAACSKCFPPTGNPTRWIDLPPIRIMRSVPGKIVSLHRSGGAKNNAAMQDHTSLEKTPIKAVSGEIPTLAEYIAIARDVCGLLPADDADRKHLERLISIADQSAGDLDNLAVQTVATYAKRINSDYRAAILNGRTWKDSNRQSSAFRPNGLIMPRKIYEK